MALVEQQNALQRFADDAGYKVVGWYKGMPMPSASWLQRASRCRPSSLDWSWRRCGGSTGRAVPMTDQEHGVAVDWARVVCALQAALRSADELWCFVIMLRSEHGGYEDLYAQLVGLEPLWRLDHVVGV